MAKTPANELARLIKSLQNERATLIAKIEEIDATFASFGIEADATLTVPAKGKKKAKKKAGSRGPGRPPKTGKKKTSKKKGKRRGRGSFAKTGEQAVLDFVKSAGQPNSKEVNAAWTKEGRAGRADNMLTKLVKEGKLKRVTVKDERGSRYKSA